MSIASHDPSLRVAYFYCSIGDSASQTPVNVLGSIVAQLSGSDPSILSNIRSVYNQIPRSQAHRFPAEISLLEDSIIQCSSRARRTIVLVDAVNESHDMEHIERSLLRLASLAQNIRVVVTTTATMIPRQDANAMIMNINAEKMRGDIDAFIKHRLGHDEVLESLPPHFKAEIEATLLKSANGS